MAKRKAKFEAKDWKAQREGEEQNRAERKKKQAEE